MVEPVHRYLKTLDRKSRDVTAFLDRRIVAILVVWLVAVCLLSAWRLSSPAAPIHNLGDAIFDLVGYAVIAVSPCLGFAVATIACKGGGMEKQPDTRLAIIGQWRRLSKGDARALPAFGPIGFMTSLLVGVLLNVVIRTLEFFAAVPAMGVHAPHWGRALFALTAVDVVLMSFFYLVAFVLALRAVPLFPRFLAFVWLLDITMQLFIANRLAAIGGIPAEVAAPLGDLLEGNITKVLISAAIWLPYLLLSERVNVTYRYRVRADSE